MINICNIYCGNAVFRVGNLPILEMSLSVYNNVYDPTDHRQL